MKGRWFMSQVPSYTELYAFYQDGLQEYLRDLQMLVNQDSGTEYKEGVDRVADMCIDKLASFGCSIERIPSEVYGDAIIAKVEASSKRKVILIGHMDTVYPKGTAELRPFTIEGEYAYGPGVADMKSGLLLGIYTLRLCKHIVKNLDREVVMVLNSDEEVGSPFSAEIIRNEAKGATAAFVLEPGRPRSSVVVARKGVYNYELIAKGRSAHAGANPRDGRNAIVALAKAITEIAQWDKYPKGVTINAGTISGGTKPNVVPDFASAYLDVRVRRTADLEIVEEHFAQISERLSKDVVNVHFHRVGSCFPPMEPSEGNRRLYELAKDLAQEIGFKLGAVETGGASDANNIAMMGVPVLDGLGPVGEKAHSPEERMFIPSIAERGALLSSLILRV